ncbi:MAG: alpha/beta hydrolase [Methylocella sp.]
MEETDLQLFSAYKVKPRNNSDTLSAYLIESTAPDNIDDNINYYTSYDDSKYKDKLTQLKVDKNGALDEIVSALYDKLCNHDFSDQNYISNPDYGAPTLVISVHGFNNPRDVILPGFWDSFVRVDKDEKIRNEDVVCIGYRWPSERMFSPLSTLVSALPALLGSVFVIGAVLLGSEWLFHEHGNITDNTTLYLTLLTSILLFIPVTLILLRAIVYFRDGYRATAFGVPDLVEVIRQIDKRLNEELNKKFDNLNNIEDKQLKKNIQQLKQNIDDGKRRVRLSFIGHSMGAYVVTSVVRILSDVFDPATMREGLNNPNLPSQTQATNDPNAIAQEKLNLSKIGNVYRLARLILASPDIPAEALAANRANFLSNALTRFEEIYLFSNEGDEVLRLISTTVNYFSLPTKRKKFGYRLGNVCLSGRLWGVSHDIKWCDIKIGDMNLAELSTELNIKPGNDLPSKISYFDCTDCVDGPDEGSMRGMLTWAKRGKPMGRGYFNHLLLLFRYSFLPAECPLRIDVHGGYFRSDFLSELIYRLACLGYEKMEAAYGGESQLSEKCKEHQVKALLALQPKASGAVSS